jgi:integration host factor subunit beta
MMIKSQLNMFLSKLLPQISEKKINSATNLIIKQLSETLISGKRIEIRGFGSFSLHHRPPRQAFNPKTGNRVTTDAKFIPHFKPGKALKQGIDDSKTKYDLDASDED